MGFSEVRSMLALGGSHSGNPVFLRKGEVKNGI